jgi:hypothetical protein
MSTEHKRTPICQEKGSKPISIDPQAITHAFIALTHGDLKHSADAKEIIAKMNRHCQPKLWNVKFHVKFVTFGASASSKGSNHSFVHWSSFFSPILLRIDCFRKPKIWAKLWFDPFDSGLGVP